MSGKMAAKTRILVIDNDPSICKFVRATLAANGYKVLVALDGSDGLHLMESELPDLLILDIMMPKIDGFDLLRRVREWSAVPNIMLSSRTDDADKVKCLDIGADDYLTKPFSLTELLARIRAVLRRSEKGTEVIAQANFAAGTLQINFAEHNVRIGGQEMLLTPTEYNLLRELTLNANRVLTYQQLLAKVWGQEYTDDRGYIHVFIRRLRKRLVVAPGSGWRIVTVPTVGYRFETTDQ